MNKIFLFSMLSFLLVKTSNAQQTIGFGIKVKTNSVHNGDSIESSNRQCNTHVIFSNTPTLFCRYDINKNMGIKIGFYRRNRDYITTFTTISGAKSVFCPIGQMQIPISFYIKKPSVVGKFYAMFDFEGMLITKKNRKFDYTTVEKPGVDIPFYSQQNRDWGGIFTFSPGCGYTISRRSRIELCFEIEVQFYGKNRIENTYLVKNENETNDVIIDKIVETPMNRDFNWYLAASYVYMIVKKEKKTSSN